MSTFNKKVVSAVGVLVLGSITTAVSATTFQATELAAGYQLSAAEAACGADKAKTDDKSKEAKCGADKAATADKAKEGKCGEGKCGGDKMADKATDKAATTDKAKEGKCGEGKCGEGKCGGMN
ncbi:hypothetical protein [Rheinheimera sp.]|uniref:HvfA family oxazolone/thioamide-modified RiPP metallophore n=1 Tax=Rheinheimera sp. TaxID=1869214 RepID=UPI0027B8CF80|nr:hypothetical protein [Rheinheimera sp.]